jgi:hypothetical protein
MQYDRSLIYLMDTKEEKVSIYELHVDVVRSPTPSTQAHPSRSIAPPSAPSRELTAAPETDKFPPKAAAGAGASSLPTSAAPAIHHCCSDSGVAACTTNHRLHRSPYPTPPFPLKLEKPLVQMVAANF